MGGSPAVDVLGARRGEQVLQRLRERPPAIWYGGEQVADVTAHPAFAGGVRTLAELYDLQWQDPDVSLFVAEAGGPRFGRSFQMPRAAGARFLGEPDPRFGDYRDGTTDILLEPLDFIARLAALVPPPRVHLTRYHGVFAANAALRAAITPAGRGSKARSCTPEMATPKHGFSRTGGSEVRTRRRRRRWAHGGRRRRPRAPGRLCRCAARAPRSP